MSDQGPAKTYCVVAIRDDGSRRFIQGHLLRNAAEAIRASLLGTFPNVLIEDDKLPLDHSVPPDSNAP